MNLRDALQTQDTVTENGMATNSSSLNHCVDLFFQIGAMRGMDTKRLVSKFSKAYNEDSLVAMRILFWSRDVRGGAGERQIFRDLLGWLCEDHSVVLNKNIHLISEYGRWDDILTLVGTTNCWLEPLALIKTALENKEGLCAKWMPRKGVKANTIRKYMKMTPKEYRKMIVGLTNVVETSMCSKEWKNINYSKLPSLASARYQKAFHKNDGERYQEYVESLKKGTTKVNAGAVYPYDIVKSSTHGDWEVANEQWKALPNYMEGSEEIILPIVDVSGSMSCPAGNNPNLSCMDVSISLGLYLSERNEGPFKDTFVTFSANPELQVLNGNLRDRISQLRQSDWGMNTNLEATFRLILDQAVKHQVPQNEMPTKVLVLSDMEFDSATGNQCQWYNGDSVPKWNPTAQQMIKGMYKDAGYEMPDIVYWNLNARNDNFPTSVNEMGTALVSGFSPSIMKSILTCEDFTPYNMMMETIDSPRYEPIRV
tara:strand:- start:3042 stop:4487 length:1446 start_codon:yes stop_codon:yes gene_type:complete